MIDKKFSASHGECGEWFTSSYSNSGGSCVEVRLVADTAMVRDSKDRSAHRPVLHISREGWGAFLNVVGRL
ncbi:DUF397 domain-containing protein [Lentzea sp.]|uniref:DUF397 domain-containing protein n=1 Tax=Lentzea sp. TaxID=56099 RepID=UPI002ECFF5B4